ncbi:type II toxin-antitoxin system RelE/ParE family toxin [Streptomyces endophyticus]|uniref:Type II toxin-antitoxin system RelE/ParE family toxin n=1 Tax=Streptomyces endophyticus TaxID=714166 RepID=A0ABU6F9F7_9ACTN|nr:type II toxin-antitoxin system RelE/ParE family toxin [Streptomyces endophyticus]MEB8339432.1 type II toxin-antitoxin system RelE/ParE family toxin [Streptomyces endophyticus]
MPYKIVVVEPACSWLHSLRQSDRGTLLQIAQALNVLEQEGPALGRPLVDRIAHSALPNLKELRPGSSGTTEVRLLFAFDVERNAVILVGGDKAGDWSRWCRSAIKAAEEAYAVYVKESS